MVADNGRRLVKNMEGHADGTESWRKERTTRAYLWLDCSWKEHHHACIQRSDVGIFRRYVLAETMRRGEYLLTTEQELCT